MEFLFLLISLLILRWTVYVVLIKTSGCRTWSQPPCSCSSPRSSSRHTSAPPPADRASSQAGWMAAVASRRSNWTKCSSERRPAETALPRSSWTRTSWGICRKGTRNLSACSRQRRRARRRRWGRRRSCWSGAKSRRCPSTWPSTCWGIWSRWRRWRARGSRLSSTAKSSMRSGSKANKNASSKQLNSCLSIQDLWH